MQARHALSPPILIHSCKFPSTTLPSSNCQHLGFQSHVSCSFNGWWGQEEHYNVVFVKSRMVAPIHLEATSDFAQTQQSYHRIKLRILT